MNSAGGSAASMAVAIMAGGGVFTSRGCGEWTQDPAPLIDPGQPFGDGAWLVGLEVEPGRYRTTTATEACSWRQRDDDGGLNDSGGAALAMAIALIDNWDDASFFSRGCGEWARDPAPLIEPGRPFGDGAWFVGSEVEPGRYRMATPTDECSWERRGGGHWRPVSGPRIGGATMSVVTIAPGDDAFTSSGCGVWAQVAAPLIEPGQPFGDGAWFVGSEVAPGRYRTTTPTDECEWVHIDAGGYENPGRSSFAMAIAAIEPDDTAFASRGCGEWSRIAAPLAEPGEAIGDGAWLVGSEVAPGRYRAAEDADGCRWELVEEAGVYLLPEGSRLPLRYGGGLTIVDIKPDDFSFSTGGCGWTTDLTPRVEPGQPFGDGTWLVGPEIAPGRYRASEADTCRWSRWGRGYGGFSGFEAGSGLSGDRSIADIGSDDIGFASSGCGVWSNDLAPRVEPGQPFGDGTWLVGPEIAPGFYRANDAGASCGWDRLNDFRDYVEFYTISLYSRSHFSVIDSGSRAFVDIAPGDAGFHTRGCGVWTPAP